MTSLPKMNYRQQKEYDKAKMMTRSGEIELLGYHGRGMVYLYCRNGSVGLTPLKTVVELINELDN